ncbi:MAG: HAMP domain-containing histidine kinase [Christensenellaceae bacterium]|nr:HAMP domain-containing histidine kinase [Christensenellaceae bacterium]
MKLLRNGEIKRMLVLMLIIGSIGCIACFVFDTTAGCIASGMIVITIALYLFDAWHRYKRMSELASEIDLIISGKQELNIQKYAEGEFSILECEITKLTVRLREQAELLRADKLRLADSIADISHQIRTPLTTLNLSAAALRDPSLTEEKRNEHLLKIHRQLVRIDWLVSALLKIARFDADAVELKHERIELKRLIELSSEPLLIPMELKNQTLNFEASGFMTGDLSWTAEAISNILKNCTEHMGAGKINVFAHENPLYSEIIIHDSGCGIAKEDLPHLFERFYRGKNPSENGVGIGLALSRMIITRQNGTIKAENHRDGGAMFTVRFYKGIV